MTRSSESRSVFVVHGRNLKARDAMFAFLRAIGLDPVEWSEAVHATETATPYIGEILNAAFAKASAVIVLFTPDDEARLRREWHSSREPSHETDLTGQARPNVLFEAGMAMGRDAKSTVLVELGELRPFSDIGGRHVVRLNDSTQSRQGLAQRLGAAGCPVNLDGTDWHSAGDFSSAIVASRLAGSETPEHDSDHSGTPHASTVLSEEAASLLRQMSDKRPKPIKRWLDRDGIVRIAIGVDALDGGNDRSVARAHGALEELIEKQLLRVSQELHGEKDYAISETGFKWLDANFDFASRSGPKPTLSDEARELLLAAVGADGRIIRFSSARRVNIKIKGRVFDMTDQRSAAKWQGALNELVSLSLVKAESGTVYSVTREGYAAADREDGIRKGTERST